MRNVSSNMTSLPAALKDALFVAIIGLLLLTPIVGLRTELSLESTQLFLRERWDIVSISVALLFGLRFLQNLFHLKFPRKEKKETAREGGGVSPIFKVLGFALLLFAITLPFIPGMERREVDLGVLILTYVLLGFGLNITVGLAGLLDLGYVAFFAIGAYSYALLATNPVITQFFAELISPSFWPLWSFWLCLPIAGILAAFWGILVAFPVLRLRGDYLAIVTLAFAEIIRLVLINWADFSGGPAGITGVPRPSFFGVPFTAGEHGFASLVGIGFNPAHRVTFLYYLVLALVILTYIFSLRLRKLPLGRVWEAMREDEIACRALGINIVNAKLSAFAFGALFGGLAGAFFAARQGFVSPESFTFQESAIVLTIVVLAGSHPLAIILASIIMIGGVELLRELDFLKAIFGEAFEPTHYRMLIFGLTMVLIMLWRPRGLMPDRTPSILLKPKSEVQA